MAKSVLKTTDELDSSPAVATGADEEVHEDPPSELTQAETFDVLSSQRRRFVLHYLARNEGQGTLRDLATIVAAWENGTSREELSSKLRTRAYTTLRQTHLPKMDDYGVIEYDSDSGTVVLTDAGDQLTAYLDSEPGADGRWWVYYLGVGLCGVLLGVLASGPFASILSGYSAALVTGTIVASLAVVQFVQTSTRRRYTDEIPEEDDVETS